jgi:hypothetical protein
VINLFQGTIEKVVALAVLMPIVASMGGIAGTQTLTVLVRALAMGQVNRSNALAGGSRVAGRRHERRHSGPWSSPSPPPCGSATVPWV